jgi:serine/threonine protein kinase
MPDITADKLAQRIFDCGLLPSKSVSVALAEAGGPGRASLDNLISILLEKELLTNWQISRVCENQKRGYFFGKWRLLYLVGSGTFARVYRAIHTESGDSKAVKVLRQRFSTDAATRENFIKEGRIVMQLRHKNITPIYEVEEQQNRIYMVMDFVEGQNLRDYVKAHGKLPIKTALSITSDILAGLAYASLRNIYHRDMKLSNVLLSSTGVAKLVDFGLAIDTEADEKGGPRSIDYAGLERFTGVRKNDPQSDLFFVGCMLYQMLCGKPPLEETRERIKRLSKQRFTDVVPLAVHDPELPHRVVVLVQRLMALDTKKRPETAVIAQKEVDFVLEAIESGDNKAYEAAEEDNSKYLKQQSELSEGEGKTVLLIESNSKVQDSLRDRLKKIGYRVLITADPARGLSRFEELDPSEEMPADCVIFGCAGLGREAVKAFEGFIQYKSTAQLPAILITTDKVNKFVSSDWFNDHRDLLTMPLKFKLVKKALRKVLKLPVG